MTVKEYCLVPRSQIEPTRPPQVKATLSPPQPVREKRPENVTGVITKSEVDTNTLDDTMKIILRPTEYQYADGILSYLRKHPLIRWDSNGNMMSPIRDVNIFDIIRYWVTKNSTFDSNKIPDLRMMVKLVSLPESFIKNPKARGKLLKGGSLVSLPESFIKNPKAMGKLLKGGNLSSKAKRKIRWHPY